MNARHGAIDRQDVAMKAFDTFLQGSASRCGQIRDSQRDFLFGENTDEIGSVALVPLGKQTEIGFLAIGSADADRRKSVSRTWHPWYRRASRASRCDDGPRLRATAQSAGCAGRIRARPAGPAPVAEGSQAGPDSRRREPDDGHDPIRASTPSLRSGVLREPRQQRRSTSCSISPSP